MWTSISSFLLWITAKVLNALAALQVRTISNLQIHKLEETAEINANYIEPYCILTLCNFRLVSSMRFLSSSLFLDVSGSVLDCHAALITAVFRGVVVIRP